MLVDAVTAFLVVIDVQEPLLPVMANTVVERNCAVLMQ